MAEEIVQRLGFETGDAISNIDALKTALEGLNTSLTSAASAIRVFNSLSDLMGKVDQLAQKMETGFNNIKPPQLTFDTSAALNQINQLTSAWGKISSTAPTAFKQQFAGLKAGLADYVNQNNISRDQVIQAFAGTLSGSTPAITGLKSKVEELKTAFNSAANTAQSAGSKIGGFFSQLGKIAVFRAILTTLNELTNGMSEGVSSAANFSLRIGQIGAIMEDTTMSMGQVRTKLLELSSEFARPLGETTLGFYQALQNQLGTTAEAMGVFQAAATLSAANVAPMTDSVNLLSSALKGWHLPMSDAGRLSGMFFEAIKIGRMEAVDLADVLGRIGPIAHAMGIGIEEAMGSVAIMTQQGTKASTAITQLGALMTALMKPTKELKATMKEKWGVDNAEQAIQKFGGLMGVMRQLESLTGGATDEMIKFTKNVRAVRAEMGLLGPNAAAAEKAIQQLKNATADTAKEAAKMVLDTSGGQYKKSVEDLANAWTRLGENLLTISTYWNKLKTGLLDFIGTGVGQFTLFTAAIFAATVAIKAYAGAMIAATLATSGFLAKLALAHPLLAAFAAGALIGQGIEAYWHRASQSMTAYFDAVDAKTKASDEKSSATIEKQTSDIKRYYDSKIQAALNASTQLTVALQKETEAIQTQQKSIIDTTKKRFDSILAAQQSYLQKLITAESSYAQKVIELNNKITTQKGALADKEFENNLRRWDQEQQESQKIARAKLLQSQAESKLSKSATPEDMAQVEELLARAQKYYEAVANGSKNETQAEAARRGSLDIDKDRIKMTEKQRDLTKSEGESLKGTIKSTQELITKLDAAFDAYLKKLKESKSALDPKAQLESYRQLIQAGTDIASLISEKVTVPPDFLGLSKIANEVNTQLDEVKPFTLQVILDMKSLNDQLAEPMNMLSKKAQDILGGAAGGGFQNFGNAITAAITSTKESLDGLLDKMKAVKDSAADLKNKLLSAMQTNMPKTGDTVEGQLDKIIQYVPRMGEASNKIRQDVTNMLALKPGDAEGFKKGLENLTKDIASFKKKLNDELVKMGPHDLSIVNIDITSLEDALDLMRKDITKNVEDINNMEPAKIQADTNEAKSKLESLLQILEMFKIKAAETSSSASSIGTAIENSATSTASLIAGFDSSTQAAQITARAVSSIKAQIDQAVQSAQQLVATLGAAGGGAQNAAFGGIIHRASGGFVPRWTDTQLAALTPGEVVMNTAASARFAPQLQAMNAGSQPVFRDRGGPVTNVGDVNVTVQGGSSDQQTIKNIAYGLRRGIKNGIIRLN